MSRLVHLVGSNEIERKRTKLYIRRAYTYLNLFTSSRCRQMGEKFPVTFISIRERKRGE